MMFIVAQISRYYREARQNKWLHYFAVFCRITLAAGFIPSGIVKIMGERFAAGLSANHPLGHYLEALFYTEYYYTFIGISQLLIALLLLVPRTALIGALLYLPVILNICVLAYATRFEGTRITTLMLLANLFLLCWDFERLKQLVLFPGRMNIERRKAFSKKFPVLFFTGVIAAIAAVILINQYMYDIRPGNIPLECTNGCAGNSDPAACEVFCDCIHNQGKPLGECLNAYHKGSK